MTKRSRIDIPYGVLVEATVPILEADEAFSAASRQRNEARRRLGLKEISIEEVARIWSRLDYGPLPELLGAGVLASWPPACHDRESRQRLIRYLESSTEPGWGKWYILVEFGDGGGKASNLRAIGIGGFKGPPSNEGVVEIEVSIVEPYDAAGTITSMAVAVFVALAFEDSRVQRVVGEHSPLPYQSDFGRGYVYPSILAFGRNGFVNAGAGSHAGSIRFERTRKKPLIRIETPRLTLLEATIPLLTAEGEHVASRQSGLVGFWGSTFEQLLRAKVEAPWPPPLNDEASRCWMIRYLEANPDPGWGMYYFVVKGGPNERSVAIGNGGYKGEPTADGTVEIGYSVVPSYQGRGFASEAIAGLVLRAFEDARVQRVVADTHPDNIPSIRVLQKNGFVDAGPGTDPGSIRLLRERGL